MENFLFALHCLPYPPRDLIINPIHPTFTLEHSPKVARVILCRCTILNFQQYYPPTQLIPHLRLKIKHGRVVSFYFNRADATTKVFNYVNGVVGL